jgi:CRP/FNR family transcriptional regulator, anaerobic regulatory protein
MIENRELEKHLSYLGQDLISKIRENGKVIEVGKDTEIVREGQYIKNIPIVIKGLVKVTTRHEDKELLLYYIEPFESCVMSFSACLKNDKSKIFATTEEDSTLILIPSDLVLKWLNDYPSINRLFYQQYNLRYLDLIDTINHLLYQKLDKRLYEHLKEKVLLTGKNPYIISHREIALELGTAREVITRVLKKLENDNKIRQLKTGIRVM